MGGGCFVSCFGSSSSSSNHRKRRNQTNYKVLPPCQRNGSHKPLQSNGYPEQNNTAKPGNLIQAKKNKLEEDLSLNTRKRVTFDSNVRTYEPVSSVRESVQVVLENEKRNEENLGKCSPSHPSHYSYKNCQDTDEELEALKTDWDDGQDSDYYAEDEDSESYDDINNERIVGQETNGLDKRERKTSVVHAHSLSNPVENLSQWKAVKMKHPQEENFIDQSLFDFKSKKFHQNQEISVDASISNWLASSEITLKKKATLNGPEPISSERSISQGSTPEVSIQDGPILGALTVEELREFSLSKSLRRPPSRRSLDDRWITDTVGSYWRHSGPPMKDIGTAFSYKGLRNTTTSKYGEISVK